VQGCVYRVPVSATCFHNTGTRVPGVPEYRVPVLGTRVPGTRGRYAYRYAYPGSYKRTSTGPGGTQQGTSVHGLIEAVGTYGSVYFLYFFLAFPSLPMAGHGFRHSTIGTMQLMCLLAVFLLLELHHIEVCPDRPRNLCVSNATRG
jgi:hypothetical protein